MYPAVRLLLKVLVLPIALGMALYSSTVSLELLADIYTPSPTPPEVPDTLPVINPDDGMIDRVQRELITTRTVKCFAGCDNKNNWGSFATYSGTKQNIEPEPEKGQGFRNSKERTLTAGVDRLFGRHLFGVALASSNIEGDTLTETRVVDDSSDPFDDSILKVDLDSDRRSLGFYYGLSLPYYINLSAQVLLSDYSYDALYFLAPDEFSPAVQTDFSSFDGSGHSTALGGSALVPFITGDFEFLFEPSISYQKIKTKTDDFFSDNAQFFPEARLNSNEWQFGAKWRFPRVINGTVVVPIAGLSYTLMDGVITRDDTKTRNDYQLFEGVVGLTIQRNNFNFSAVYSKTIHVDKFERKRFLISFRIIF